MGVSSSLESNESTEAIDGQLDQVQASLVSKNKSEPYFSGFSVLVYSGVDRQKAFKTRDDLAMNFPDLTPEMQYQQRFQREEFKTLNELNQEDVEGQN